MESITATRVIQRRVFLILVGTLLLPLSMALVPLGPAFSFTSPRRLPQLGARSYGLPIEDVDDSNDNQENTIPQRERELFEQLIYDVAAVKDPQHIPSLLAKNMELILSISKSKDGVKVIESILQEASSSSSSNQEKDAENNIVKVIDLVVTFAENFVEEAARLDTQNKQLLGKIILLLSNKDETASSREQALDELLHRDKAQFTTAGFMRHVQGECQRIANAPSLTRESMRLLEFLRLIQTRVWEEVGRDLGEAASVLGQLVSYDSKSERLAVLDAGLTVRGPAFAQELLALTEEALVGFQTVIGGADPELVVRIEEVDHRLRSYLESAIQPTQ